MTLFPRPLPLMTVRSVLTPGFLGPILVLALALTLAGCGAESGQPNEPGKPVVVATTTMIADLAQVLGGDDVTVVGIMKTGEDPHVYDVRPNDARVIARADLVLMNGLHLEATLGEVVEHNASGTVVKLVEAAGIDPLGAIDDSGAPDPHVWMDVTLWSQCVTVAADAMAQAAPDHAPAIYQRATDYLAELQALDAQVRTLLDAVPPTQRVIVTSHDAFSYFGRAYGVDVHAVIGISTEQQPRPQDIDALCALIEDRGVQAVFIESSTSATLNQIVKKVARETGTTVGGTLYSDSLGDPETDAGTYVGMIRHNATTIATALTPPPPGS